jgi:dolichyl-diphosphooligosaccharide--protein glycosyltransferase
VQQARPNENPSSGPLQRLTPWLLFGVALLVRSLPAASVFIADRIHLVSYDAYYRLRRIRYRLGESTTPLELDPYVHFPDGGKPVMPTFFDAVLTAFVRPFAGFDEQARMEMILVWLPPLIGALTVVALYHIALRHFGARTAAVSAWLLAILPAHVYYSRLSFIDHHVAVALLSTALLGTAMTLLARVSPPSKGNAGIAGIAILLGALHALNLLVWPGAILHVAIVEIAFLVCMMRAPGREATSALALALMVQNGVAFLLVTPAALDNHFAQLSPYSAVVLSRFQPWFFGSLAVCGAGCMALWKLASSEGSTNVRTLQTLLVGLATLATSALILPGLVDGVVDAWTWMTAEDASQRNVAESRPLFRLNHRFSTVDAHATFSLLLWVFPVFAVALIALERRRKGAVVYLLVGWAAVFSAATIAQNRYKNTLSVAFALIVGWGIVRIDDALRARIRSPGFRLEARLALAVLVIACLGASLGEYWQQLRESSQAIVSGTVPARPMTQLFLQQHEVAEWIRDNTPTTSGVYDAGVRPEYSVYAPWGLGHTLKYVAERPTTVDNFGEYAGHAYFAMAENVDLAEPEQAEQLLDRLGAHYIVVRGALLAPRINRQLYGGERIVPGFRLLWESTPASPGEMPQYQVFERVRSASLIGRADPGMEVGVNLGFRTNQGRTGTMQLSVETDLGGVYRLDLPYATISEAGEIVLSERYSLIAVRDGRKGSVARIAVSESQLAQGATIEGPDLRGVR